MLVAHKIGIAIGALLFPVSDVAAWAQVDNIPRDDASEVDDALDCKGPCSGPRTLGGHTFVPSTLVDWPFIVTRVASTTSVGVAELEMPAPRLEMRLGIEGGTGEFVYADQSMLGSVAIAPWLAVAVRAQGSLIIPTGTAGAVLIGEHGLYGGNAIASVRLIRWDRFQATVLVDGGRVRPTSVVPARLPSSPYEQGDLTTLRPALAIAYAFTPRLGVQASASHAWQWFEVTEKDQFRTLAASAALTYDVHRVPLTLLAASQYSHESGESSEMDAMDVVYGTGETHVWGEAGLVYRGVSALDLGAALHWKLDDADDNSRWFGQLRLAYYFR